MRKRQSQVSAVVVTVVAAAGVWLQGCSQEAGASPKRVERAQPSLQVAADPLAQPPAAHSAVPIPASDPLPRVIPQQSLQAIVVTASAWNVFNAKMTRYERSAASEPWRAVEAATDVVLGRNGMAWGRGIHPNMADGIEKREGDHRSPAGVFDLAEAYGYAAEPPEGTRWGYTRLTQGWRCGSDARADDYNTFVVPNTYPAVAPAVAWDGSRPGVSFELLVPIKHNTQPVVAGAGSCVLLHVWIRNDVPTQGCTAMPRPAMQQLLGWLDPKARPVLVQLPQQQLERLAGEWGIPR